MRLLASCGAICSTRCAAATSTQCEQWLAAMDEMYGVLVTIDYPDAMTGGLRRTTDAVRGILEKTRGDLTLSVQQRRLEERLAEFGQRLPE